MEMKNLKMDMAEQKMESQEDSYLVEKSPYPYGLKLCLEEEVIQKMGLKEMPALGQKMMIQAVGEVVALEKENYGGENKMEMRIQLTDMGMENYQDKPQMSPSEKLYGE